MNLRSYLRALFAGAVTLIGGATAFTLACGEDLELVQPNDAAPAPDATVNDASPDVVRRCSHDDPFATPPEPLPLELPPLVDGGVADDRAARLTDDELTVVFYSKRSGKQRLYIAERDAIGAPFGTSNVIDGIAGGPGALDSDPMISGDGLRLYFTTIRSGSRSFDIYVATRSTRQDSFANPVPVPANSDGYDFGGFETNTGLWLTSNRDVDASDADDFALWFAPKVEGKIRDAVYRIEGINVPGTNTGIAAPSADERALYFSSDRQTERFNGDIWLARREQNGGAFGPARRIDELATSTNEAPTWLSPDGCRLYIESHNGLAADSGATSKLVVAKRIPKP